MPVFAYTATDPSNHATAGNLVADTPADGRDSLRLRGMRITSFVASKPNARKLSLRLHSRSRRGEQVAEVARHLALLLRAGVPLAECLDVITRRPVGKFTTVLTDVRDRLLRGSSFADSLSVHDTWFDTLFVSAVRVGELTGNLDECLSRLAQHLRGRRTLQTKVTNALTYPLILSCVGIVVVVFLMTFVIPQLLAVLQTSNRPLPASTVLLKSLSDALVGYWPLFLLAVVTLIATVGVILRSDRGRRAWHRLQLRLPVVGPLIQRTVIGEFAQQLSLLLATGIPFVEAAQTVARLTPNRVLRDELSAMATAVESGSDIAPTMAGSRIFPPVVAHLVAVGQDSGELAAMLEELRNRYETEVNLALGKFTAALEPLLIVVLACAVGFVVFACMMPILEATRGIAQ